MDLDALFHLQPYFWYRKGNSDDEIFLKPTKETYSPMELLAIVDIINELAPDEISQDMKELRLWWD